MPRRSLPRGSPRADLLAAVLIAFVILLALLVDHRDKKASESQMQHTIYQQKAPSSDPRYQLKLREALHRRYEA